MLQLTTIGDVFLWLKQRKNVCTSSQQKSYLYNKGITTRLDVFTIVLIFKSKNRNSMNPNYKLGSQLLKGHIVLQSCLRGITLSIKKILKAGKKNNIWCKVLIHFTLKSVSSFFNGLKLLNIVSDSQLPASSAVQVPSSFASSNSNVCLEKQLHVYFFTCASFISNKMETSKFS